ncbi:hypothetical protein V1477_009713, partial [Vespula maculifrons]
DGGGWGGERGGGEGKEEKEVGAISLDEERPRNARLFGLAKRNWAHKKWSGNGRAPLPAPHTRARALAHVRNPAGRAAIDPELRAALAYNGASTSKQATSQTAAPSEERFPYSAIFLVTACRDITYANGYAISIKRSDNFASLDFSIQTGSLARVGFPTINRQVY